MKTNTKYSIFAWSFYDFANSAFATTVMAVFFPLFFNEYYSFGADTNLTTARLGIANSIAGIFVSIISPFIGTLADKTSSKKKYLIITTYFAIVMTFALFFISKGNWLLAAMVYILAVIGFSQSMVFYDALLTTVSNKKNVGIVSSLGYSLGYLGGGLLLLINILMIKYHDFFHLDTATTAIKFSFASVAIWWGIFSIPLFLFVHEKKDNHKKPIQNLFLTSFKEIMNTIKKIKSNKVILLFLLSYWFYIDGVNTIIRMAVDYGISIKLDKDNIVTALLITQFVGFPSAIAFGYLAKHINIRNTLLITIFVYLLVSIWSGFMESSFEFYVLAVAIGIVQGGIQALSRAHYTTMIPKESSAEYFGFYNMIGKFAVVLGPIVVGFTGLLVKTLGYSPDIATRFGIMSISTFFLIGGTLFYFSFSGKK